MNECLASIEDAAGLVAGTMSLEQSKKIEARAALIAADGALNKWITRFDAQIAKSGSGMTVYGDSASV